MAVIQSKLLLKADYLQNKSRCLVGFSIHFMKISEDVVSAISPSNPFQCLTTVIVKILPLYPAGMFCVAVFDLSLDLLLCTSEKRQDLCSLSIRQRRQQLAPLQAFLRISKPRSLRLPSYLSCFSPRSLLTIRYLENQETGGDHVPIGFSWVKAFSSPGL